MRWKRNGWQAAICAALVGGCLLPNSQTGDDDDDDDDVVYQGVNVINCTQDIVAVYATNNQGDWGDLITTLSPTGDLTEGGEATCENTTYVPFDAPQGGTSWVRAIVDLNDCAGPTWESDDCNPQTNGYDVDVEIGDIATFSVN